MTITDALHASIDPVNLRDLLMDRADAIRQIQTRLLETRRELAAHQQTKAAIELSVTQDPEVQAGKNAEVRKALLDIELRQNAVYCDLLRECADIQNALDQMQIQFDYTDRMYKIDLALLRTYSSD